MAPAVSHLSICGGGIHLKMIWLSCENQSITQLIMQMPVAGDQHQVTRVSNLKDIDVHSFGAVFMFCLFDHGLTDQNDITS